jgi:hypothetical protein
MFTRRPDKRGSFSFDIELSNEHKRFFEDVDETHRGVIEARIIRRGHAVALFRAAASGVLSDADLFIANRLRNWKQEMLRRNRHSSLSCGFCATGFYVHEKPDAFIVVTTTSRAGARLNHPAKNRWPKPLRRHYRSQRTTMSDDSIRRRRARCGEA